MNVESVLRYAMVIEPHHPLAERVADSLRKRGYVVGIASTHAGGAAWAASRTEIDILIAAVPQPGESTEASYLARARDACPAVAMVVLVTDHDEHIGDAPGHAVKIAKPFSLLELEEAIEQALASAAIRQH